MTNTADFLHGLRPRTILVLWAGFIGSYLLLNFTDAPFSLQRVEADAGGRTILNVLPYYDASLAYAYLNSYGPAARQAYRLIVALDVFLLIPLYSLAFAGTLARLGRRVFARRPRAVNALAGLPLLAAGLNLVEDGAILILLGVHPHRLTALATASGLITAAKTIAISASVFGIVLLLATVGISRVSHMAGLRSCHI